MPELNDVIVYSIAMTALGLSLEIIPGLNDLWLKVEKKWKPLVVAGLCFVIPFAFVGASCLGVDVGFGNICPDPKSPQMWFEAGMLGVFAYLSSQGGFAAFSAQLGERMKEE